MLVKKVSPVGGLLMTDSKFLNRKRSSETLKSTADGISEKEEVKA